MGHDLPGVTAMGAQAKRSVLVVENEGVIRRMICAALEIKGFRVLQAGNGREALHQLSRYPVDLILTDWCMPEMCGQELIARVRENTDRPRLPIIVVSGTTPPDNPGVDPKIFDRWLTKPFRIGEIQNLVMETIGNAA